MIDGIPTIPIAAWQQAAIVSLFVVFAMCSFLALRWIIKEFSSLMKTMTKDYQDFISSRDLVWQSYFEQREDEFSARNGAVVESIKALTGAITKLSDQTAEHADETRVAIATMKERTTPRGRAKAQ